MCVWSSWATQVCNTVAVHFINGDWGLRSFVLDTSSLPGSHTGQNSKAKTQQLRWMMRSACSSVSAQLRRQKAHCNGGRRMPIAFPIWPYWPRAFSVSLRHQHLLSRFFPACGVLCNKLPCSFLPSNINAMIFLARNKLPSPISASIPQLFKQPITQVEARSSGRER